MKSGLFLLIFVLLAGAIMWIRYPLVPIVVKKLPLVMTPSNSPITSPTPSLMQPLEMKILANDYHVFQNFNNCGPAALSMELSYYAVQVDQNILGQALRPYQNPQGDNDDKSVTLAELAEKSKEYALVPFHRPNGTIEMTKLFITYDMPVITRTWLNENEDIGHYRVIKGYDDRTQELIQDDSLQGSNLRYSYDQFNTLWKKFNYEYLVLVPQDKVKIVEAILGEDVSEQLAWEKAVTNANNELLSNPDDMYARFNLLVALYKTGQYEQAVGEYEKIEDRLPNRTLWYQIEPIQAYYQLKNYAKVFAITDTVLNNHNRAFSELYVLRGDIYKERGEIELAKQEYQKAVLYNQSLKVAQEALSSI